MTYRSLGVPNESPKPVRLWHHVVPTKVLNLGNPKSVDLRRTMCTSRIPVPYSGGPINLYVELITVVSVVYSLQ